MLLRFLHSSDRLITISYMWFTPGGVSEQFFKMACLDTHNVEVKYSHNGSRQTHLLFCITLFKISLKVYMTNKPFLNKPRLSVILSFKAVNSLDFNN